MPSPSNQSSEETAVDITIDSPTAQAAAPFTALTEPPAYESIQVNGVLYSSACLALLQTVQFGWSLSQLNLSAFNDKNACNARPVVEGTCLMFPGHTTTQWTWVVNAWVVGGMVGSLSSGNLSDRFGRKTTMLANCLVMAAGAIVQASASSVAVFAIGRAIAGLASGISTAMPNGYISEIAPPHIRNQLGVGFQIAIATGLFLACTTFFFANTASGWRYIAGFPAVMALVFAVAAPKCMVESPAWLLGKGRQADAEQEIAKLFGHENIALALTWMQPQQSDIPTTTATSPTSKMQQVDANVLEVSSTPSAIAENPWKAMVSPAYRQQTIIAVCMALALQFSGINAVFMYSSSMFSDAGVSDGRIGSIIVNTVNLLPSFGAGWLASRYGNRTLLLTGQSLMLLCAIGLTVALLVDVPALSIAFIALYVAVYSVTLGSLAFVVAADVFPDELRASGGAIALFANWTGTLVIGVGYPYVNDALGDLGFVPFIVTVAMFTLFMLKFLPETSGKTSDEIQELFRKGA
jgi:sugar porter (SP) family MFS transporter